MGGPNSAAWSLVVGRRQGRPRINDQAMSDPDRLKIRIGRSKDARGKKVL